MIRVVALASLVVALSACTSHPSPGAPGARATAAPALTSDAPSIYPLRAQLRDQRGAELGLDAFRGHPVVVSMFYGSCPTACPLIVSHVKQIEAQLPPDARRDVRVLLVSFDPAHDTPTVLAGIAAARGLDASRWTLATAGEDDVRQIAAVLGVSYHALPGGGFAHDSVLTVLDRDGRPVARVDDPNADLAPLAAAITRVASSG